MSGESSFSFESNYYRFSILSGVSYIIDDSDENFFSNEESRYQSKLSPLVPKINQIIDTALLDNRPHMDELGYVGTQFIYKPGEGWSSIYSNVSSKEATEDIKELIKETSHKPVRITLCSPVLDNLPDRFEIDIILSSKCNVSNLDKLNNQLDRLADELTGVVLIEDEDDGFIAPDSFKEQETNFSFPDNRFSDKDEYYELGGHFPDRAIDSRFKREVLEKRSIEIQKVKDMIRSGIKEFRGKHEHGIMLRPFSPDAPSPWEAEESGGDNGIINITVSLNEPQFAPCCGVLISATISSDVDDNQINHSIWENLIYMKSSA